MARRSIGLVLGVLTLVGPSGASAGSDAPPTLEFLPDGLAVGSTAPDGWSRLVVKSMPRVATGDTGTLPEFALAMATRFRTVIVVDVGPDGDGSGRARLRRVGLGLCWPDGSTDVVVRPDSNRARTQLGFVDRQVLEEATRELTRGRLIAATSGLAVLRCPTRLKTASGHAEIDLYYAFLVDRVSGQTRVFAWALPRRAVESPRPWLTRELSGDPVYSCGLDVEAVRLLGAVPVSWSFAMNDLPPGRPIAPTPALSAWLTRPDRLAARPDGFEAALRDLAAGATDPVSRPGSRSVPRGSAMTGGRGTSADGR